MIEIKNEPDIAAHLSLLVGQPLVAGVAEDGQRGGTTALLGGAGVGHQASYSVRGGQLTTKQHKSDCANVFPPPDQKFKPFFPPCRVLTL